MKRKTLVLFTLGLFLSSCSALRDLSDIREPAVVFSDVSFQSVTFDGVTLLFDFEVTNPNLFEVSAEQYQYEFFINDRSFLTGNQQEGISVGSEETHLVQVPVTLNFKEVAETFGSFVRQDSLSYQLSTEVEFNLPVVGNRTVPVQAGGQFPIPKIPRIRFGDFDVKQMSFSGAEIEVSFHITNPNPFGISLESADYRLDVNGKEWLNTTLDQNVNVSGSETEEVIVPISLNALQLGSALQEIVTGNRDFQYKLRGNAEISAELEGFGGQTIPFNLTGRYRLNDSFP